MKRKDKTKRSRFKRRKDDQLLLAYARHEYQNARVRKAKETGVDVAMIQDRLGFQASIKVGHVRLVQWFNALPEPAKETTRGELAAKMRTHAAALFKAETDAIVKAGAYGSGTIDEHLMTGGRS